MNFQGKCDVGIKMVKEKNKSKISPENGGHMTTDMSPAVLRTGLSLQTVSTQLSEESHPYNSTQSSAVNSAVAYGRRLNSSNNRQTKRYFISRHNIQKMC